jgi:hypothetical protein
MTCAADSARSKLHPNLGMEFFQRILCMLEKSRHLTSEMTRKESTALKSLRNNTQIRIIQADKGNCMVVLNESTYKENQGVYEILRKGLTSQIERKIQKLLTKQSFPLL